MVLCVDEKSQIQALDRSQPMLPMPPGQPTRRSHDYKRHGTTSLFAALDIATGRSSAGAPHATLPSSASSWMRSRPPCRANSTSVVMDNYVTHKTPLTRRWLAKRPRWHVL
jgi:hypothetical protein